MEPIQDDRPRNFMEEGTWNMSNREPIQDDIEALKLCARRVRQLERAVQRFLDAEHAGEMGNRDKAIEHLEHLMAQI
jgi:hypothetical protein